MGKTGGNSLPSSMAEKPENHAEIKKKRLLHPAFGVKVSLFHTSAGPPQGAGMTQFATAAGAASYSLL